jgi:hypothetical protein
MIPFPDNTITRNLNAMVERHFLKLNWSVCRLVLDREPVIRAVNGDFVLVIKTMDSVLQHSIGASSVLDRLEHFSRECRGRTGEVISYVFDRPLLGLDVARVFHRKITICDINALSSLSSIEDNVQMPFAALGEHEKVLLRGCKDFCIARAEATWKAGNLQEAQEWLELSLDDLRIVVRSRYKLIDLLMHKKEAEAARIAINRGLHIAPRNPTLLKYLRVWEERYGDACGVAEAEARIVAAMEPKPTFENMIKQLPSSRAAKQPDPSVTSPEDGFVQRILNRLRLVLR